MASTKMVISWVIFDQDDFDCPEDIRSDIGPIDNQGQTNTTVYFVIPQGVKNPYVQVRVQVEGVDYEVEVQD